MNDEEELLFELVRKTLRSTSETNADESDLAGVRLLVNHGRHLFPPELIDALFGDGYKYTSIRWSSANKVLDAYVMLPDGLRSKRTSNASDTGTGLDPMFVLRKDDRETILNLCATMRDAIWKSNLFDVAHQRRLADRISAVEREVNRDKGRLDVIFGGISDFGEALGRFGNNAKPLFDRMGEILRIARGGSKEYEQLPPPDEVKRLPPPDKE